MDRWVDEGMNGADGEARKRSQAFPVASCLLRFVQSEVTSTRVDTTGIALAESKLARRSFSSLSPGFRAFRFSKICPPTISVTSWIFLRRLTRSRWEKVLNYVA